MKPFPQFKDFSLEELREKALKDAVDAEVRSAEAQEAVAHVEEAVAKHEAAQKAEESAQQAEEVAKKAREEAYIAAAKAYDKQQKVEESNQRTKGNETEKFKIPKHVLVVLGLLVIGFLLGALMWMLSHKDTTPPPMAAVGTACPTACPTTQTSGGTDDHSHTTIVNVGNPVVPATAVPTTTTEASVKQSAPVQKPVVKKPKKKVARLVPSQPQTNANAPTAVVPQSVGVQQGKGIWLWHPPEASEEKPKPCIIASGNGVGLPKYCSSFSVDPKRDGDIDKATWELRVGGGVVYAGTGLYQKEGKMK